MRPNENTQICKRCGIAVNNMRRHKRAKRCEVQHQRGNPR